MNKIIYSTFLLLLIISFSCQNKAENVAENFDYKSLDYLKDFRFLLTSNDILNLLPNDKKMFSESEDGFLYTFKRDNIEHQVTALFYGDEHFNTLIATLVFSDNKNQQDAIFNHLKKMLGDKYQEPVTHDKNDLEESITWLEITMYDDVNFTIQLSKFENTITLNFQTPQKHPEDFETEDENGEWVQRGENGDWIFVPN
jgi:hypothetical protein